MRRFAQLALLLSNAGCMAACKTRAIKSAPSGLRI